MHRDIRRPTRSFVRACLWCVLALFLAPAAVRGQDWPGGIPRDPPRAKDLERPRKLLVAWATAVREHEPGKADAPARDIIKWSRDDLTTVRSLVEGIAPQLSRLTAGINVGEQLVARGQVIQLLGLSDAEAMAGDITPLLKRGSMLHTDIVAMGLESARPDLAAAVPVAQHLWFGRELMASLQRFQRSPEAAAFVHEWYRTVGGFLESQYEVTTTSGFLAAATQLFPRDAELLMLAGCAHEMLASPRVQEGYDIQPGFMRRSEKEHLEAAERLYREALAANPNLAEARLRHGHVLHQLGRSTEARDELKASLDAVDRLALRYFALLFLGDVEGALNNSTIARSFYEQAHALYPGAQSVRLALSRQAQRAGDPASAASLARQLLEVSEDWRDDPWWHYYAAGGVEEARQRLDDLRAQFRRLR